MTHGRKVALRFPLPKAAHIPGQTPRPPEGFLDEVIAQAPALTLDAEAYRNPVWHYGLILIEHGFFWEAHEVLEPVWSNAAPNGRERFLVQAVIHIANGALKLRMNRPKAASRLADLARDHLDRAFEGHAGPLMGIDRSKVAAAAAAIAEGRAQNAL